MQTMEKLSPLSHYNWHPFIPSKLFDKKGYNVLHSISENTPYEKDFLARQFVDQYLSNARRLESDAGIIR
jgi:hypothetical protein